MSASLKEGTDTVALRDLMLLESPDSVGHLGATASHAVTTSGHQTIEALDPISKSDRLDMPRVLEHDQSRFQRPTDVDPEQNGRSTQVPRSMSVSMLCQCRDFSDIGAVACI